MSENVAQTMQKVIQDLVLRELKAVVAANQKRTELRFNSQDEKFVGLQKQIDQRFDAQDDRSSGLQKQIDQRFDAQDQRNNAQFKALMAAIADGTAHNELNTVQAISALSGRVAILESRHQ